MSEVPVSPHAVAPGPKDGLFFLTILMNMKNKPEVDWNLVAQEAGYTNAKCASTRFGQMKKKYLSRGTSTPTMQSPSQSFSSVSTAPATPTGSPSKLLSFKRAKEVGSGTNVSSARVKKTPSKGSGTARGYTRAARSFNEDREGEKGVDVFVKGVGARRVKNENDFEYGVDEI